MNSVPTSGHLAEWMLDQEEFSCLDVAYLDNASVGQLHFPLVVTCLPVTYIALTLSQAVF